MLAGVLEQVADHPAQQARIAPQRNRLAFELDAFVARALLRREGEQVDVFRGKGFLRVQAAREEDLVDQRVELGDVLLQLAAALGQLERHADARERRAQLVRGVGEQGLVRPDQLLDARRGAVEALGEPRHIVPAFDFHPDAQLAGRERLDALLQPLQPARQAPHHRVGADPDRDREHRQREEQAERRVPRAAVEPRRQPAAVVELHRPCRRPAPAAQPSFAVRRGKRLADHAKQFFFRTEK